VQPLLGALRLLPVCLDLGLELCNAILGSSKLMRKPLRRIDCVSAVLLGDISSFVQKLQDRLTGFIELIVLVSLALSRSYKWNHFRAHVLPFPVALCGNAYRLFDTQMWQYVNNRVFLEALWPRAHTLCTFSSAVT